MAKNKAIERLIWKLLDHKFKNPLIFSSTRPIDRKDAYDQCQHNQWFIDTNQTEWWKVSEEIYDFLEREMTNANLITPVKIRKKRAKKMTPLVLPAVKVYIRTSAVSMVNGAPDRCSVRIMTTDSGVVELTVNKSQVCNSMVLAEQIAQRGCFVDVAIEPYSELVTEPKKLSVPVQLVVSTADAMKEYCKDYACCDIEKIAEKAAKSFAHCDWFLGIMQGTDNRGPHIKIIVADESPKIAFSDVNKLIQIGKEVNVVFSSLKDNKVKPLAIDVD